MDRAYKATINFDTLQCYNVDAMTDGKIKRGWLSTDIMQLVNYYSYSILHVVAGEASKDAKLVNMTTGLTVTTFEGEKEHLGVETIFSKCEKKRFISSKWGRQYDNGMQSHNIDTGMIEHCYGQFSNHVFDMTISNHGLIVTSHLYNCIRLWKVDNPAFVETIEIKSDAVLAVAISGDERFIMTGSKDNTVCLINMKTRNMTYLKGHQHCVHNVAISKGSTLGASADKDIILWNLVTKSCCKILKGHSDYVTDLIISDDAKTLYSSGKNGVRVWNTHSGECIHELHNDRAYGLSPLSIMISPSNRRLVGMYTDGFVRIWNIKTGLCEEVIRVNPESTVIVPHRAYHVHVMGMTFL